MASTTIKQIIKDSSRLAHTKIIPWTTSHLHMSKLALRALPQAQRHELAAQAQAQVLPPAPAAA